MYRATERLLRPDGRYIGMATDTANTHSAHLRGMTVTAVAAIFGIVAAFGSLVAVGDATPVEIATNSTMGYVIAAAIAVQYPLLKGTGIIDDFSAKDILYVAFMSFTFWFVSLTILLTAGVSF
jgi:hypothetical protein